MFSIYQCIVIEYVNAKNIWMIVDTLQTVIKKYGKNDQIFVNRLYYTGIVHNAMPILNILQMECKT